MRQTGRRDVPKKGEGRKKGMSVELPSFQVTEYPSLGNLATTNSNPLFPKERVGGENMEKIEWSNRAMTCDEIEKKIQALEEQIKAFELNVKYEEKLVAFRKIYMEWYEGRITLGELLQAMIDNGLCNRLKVFER